MTRSFWNTGVAPVVAMMEGEVEMDDSAAEIDSCRSLFPTDTRTGKASSPDRRDDANWNSGTIALERLNFVKGFGGCQYLADGM